MVKNIVIFSDGTGKSSGIYLDENRTNIYKLYRATRCGPETNISPGEQLAFYDPGVGTAPLQTGILSRLKSLFLTSMGKATGLGITTNVVECYAALIRMWEPGDKVFLFGFSRGAYTVRLLGGVMAYCGIPYRTKDGQRVKRDRASSIRLAKYAVTNIYQHMESIDPAKATDQDKIFLDQRRQLGKQFRDDYSASNEDGLPNVAPHFIGIFDTVSSLFNPIFMAIMGVLILIFLVGFAVLLSRLLGFDFYIILFSTLFAAITLSVILFVRSHLKAPGRIKKAGKGWYSESETRRWSNWRMKFNDRELSTRVVAARHALAIDERRKLFKRVIWNNDPNEDISGKPEGWFQQVWFAGVHSDVGGGYTDSEAQLSDISLKWMVDAAKVEGLKIDQRWLSLFTDEAGPQHDETKNWRYRRLGIKWRSIASDAPLHGSVIERFGAKEILNYDKTELYRPDNLKSHNDTKEFWETDRGKSSNRQ